MSENERKIICSNGCYCYQVDNEGILYYVTPTKNGEGIVSEVIANHAPILKRILIKDDGFTTNELIEFQAQRKGKLEKAVSLDKRTMIGNQPHVMFSPACMIYPGKGKIAHYSEFLQMQCEDKEPLMVYTHTGWITTDEGNQVFLNGGYSVDKNGLNSNYSVELDPDLQSFCFYPVEETPETAMKTVLEKLSEAMPDWVSVPILSYFFLTPLNEMLRKKGKEPCFTLYLIGETGTYKSSIIKLFLNFFGKFNYSDAAPTNFESSANSIGRKLAVSADVPLLLDDRRPVTTGNDKNKYESLEKFASSAIGDRAARSRLNPDGTAKQSYTAKSNLIITAEEAFENLGTSSIARAVSVELEKGTISFEKLQDLQEYPEHFNLIMQLYLQWLINHWDEVGKMADEVLKTYRKLFTDLGHARLATAFSQLLFGYLVFLLFLQEYQQIDDEKRKALINRAKEILIEMCEKQNKKVEADKPTKLFLSLLSELLETKRVRLKVVRSNKEAEDEATATDCEVKTMIGYRDENYIYLLTNVAYAEVCKFYAETGHTFPSTKANLWKALAKEEKIVPTLTEAGKFDRAAKQLTINGKQKRYIWLVASALNESEKEGDEDG